MGQAKKRRACPAVNHAITAAECGENRLSRYACPESCPFNPFQAGNYTALLAAEDVLDLTSAKRMHGEDAMASVAILEARHVNPGHGWHAAVVWHLFFKHDASGRTFAERWEQVGFPDLKNDERVFFRGKMKMRVALLEVRRVLDEQRFEAVDLLDATGPALIFVDRSMAARAVRFFTCLTWIYPLPHFWRVSGTAISTSDLGPFSSLEMIEACISHLGGPTDAVGRGRWMAENFTRIDNALMATGLERRRQMFGAMDASWGVATYELCAPFTVARKALAAEPAVAEDDLTTEERAKGFSHATVWFDDQLSAGQRIAKMGGGRTVLGRVVLGKKEWRLEATGEARLARLRAGFEARMGAMVQFSRERRDNFGGQMAEKDPAPDLALVLPRLLEEPSNIELSSLRMRDPPPGISLADHHAGFLREHRRKWMDQPLPGLDGRTPREAARDPGLRAQVIELVKGQVRQVDRQNLKTGRADDINELIRDLGLAEIDFPPPPPRQPLPATDDDDDEPGLSSAGNLMPFRPAAPSLAAKPFSQKQAFARIDGALAPFNLAADAIEELAASGSTLLEDIEDLTQSLMTVDEYSAFIPQLLRAWFALVPPGVSAPLIDYGEMESALAVLTTASKALPDSFARLIDDCGQPALLAAILGDMMEFEKKMPVRQRPSLLARMVQTIVLRFLIDALDEALRRP